MPTAFEWPAGIQCSVSLTYDDGLPIHTALVGPTLERHGLRGTFYPPTLSDLHHHPDDWRGLAAVGHELGNHTVFHPCRRLPSEGYDWLEDCYDLATYSPSRLRAELNVANFVLNLIDGQTERTYGNTCCDTTIGRDTDEQSIEPILADMFVAARGVFSDRVAQPGQSLNLLNVGCQGGDGRTLAELRDIVEEARAARLGGADDSRRRPRDPQDARGSRGPPAVCRVAGWATAGDLDGAVPRGRALCRVTSAVGGIR